MKICLGRNPPSAGMTLVEVAIVSFLIGIIAMAATPVLDSAINDFKLSGAAEEIKTAIEYAQSMALISGRATRVVFNTARNTIVVKQKVIEHDFSGPVSLTLTESQVEDSSLKIVDHPVDKGATYRIDLDDDDWFSGINLVATSLGVNSYIAFDNLGMPDKEGQVAISLDGYYIVLSIEALSGKVTLTEGKGTVILVEAPKAMEGGMKSK